MKDVAYYDEVYRGTYHVDEERVQYVAGLCRGAVLDVGCGDGALAEKYAGSYMGLDFSPVAIDLARQRNHGSEFLLYDFLANVEDDLPAGLWDTIVLGELLEHIDGGAQTMLFRKIKAVLADGGTVIATTPNGPAPDEAHIRTFTTEQMRASLRLFGPVCTHAYSDQYVVASAHKGGRPKLSVVLIVKNEEEMLPVCLESLQDVWDELVIVDTGSTDKTVEIARSHGARIGHFPWQDDFALARNYAETLCFGEYIYWQDADEILIEGRDRIREIVEEGELDGVAPFMIYSRDDLGHTKSTFLRQELLHKNNGKWEWKGAAHNWLNGPCRNKEKGIVVRHLDRPSGDRPNHTDTFEALRKNFREKGPMERSLWYLARQHYYEHHWHEAIALLCLMLETKPDWAVQRARGCVMLGNCWKAIGNMEEAANAYYRGIQECPTPAEPYFSLGELRYHQRRYREAATWFLASTIQEPGEFFVDMSIYDWRRYDLLAVCLSKIGRNEEARLYGAKALAVRPDDERLKKNMGYYQGKE